MVGFELGTLHVFIYLFYFYFIYLFIYFFIYFLFSTGLNLTMRYLRTFERLSLFLIGWIVRTFQKTLFLI